MGHDSLRNIEKEIALLVRLTTAYSPRFGSLDRSEYLLLSELDKQSPLAINSLAETLMLNLSTASRQVAALERKKLIRRFPDPNNGRISLVEMTSEGIDTLKKSAKGSLSCIHGGSSRLDKRRTEHIGNSFDQTESGF